MSLIGGKDESRQPYVRRPGVLLRRRVAKGGGARKRRKAGGVPSTLGEIGDPLLLQGPSARPGEDVPSPVHRGLLDVRGNKIRATQVVRSAACRARATGPRTRTFYSAATAGRTVSRAGCLSMRARIASTST